MDITLIKQYLVTSKNKNDTIVTVKQEIKLDDVDDKTANSNIEKLQQIYKLYTNFLNNIILTEDRYLNFAKQIYDFYEKFISLDLIKNGAPFKIYDYQYNGPKKFADLK